MNAQTSGPLAGRDATDGARISTSSEAGGGARVRAVALAVVGGLALTAVAGLCVLISSQTSRRIDVTQTRTHQLAPRTAGLMAQLRTPLTLVVADQLSRMDPSVREGLGDVVDQLVRSRAGTSAPFVARLMDTGSAQGLAEFDALIAELAGRERVVVANRVEVLGGLATQLGSLAGPVAQLAQKMDASRDAVLEGMNKNAQARWDAYAAALRTASDDAARAGASATVKLASPASPLPIPAIDEAKLGLQSAAEGLSLALSRLSGDLDALGRATDLPEGLRTLLVPLASAVGPVRDRAAQVAADVAGVKPPRVLTIARAIERGRATLLIAGGSGASDDGMGVDIVAIEPAALLSARVGVSPRASAEDVIAGAVSSLVSPVRPVVVFVHEASQRLAGVGFAPFGEAVRRLSARGIDATEWPVALDRDLPAALSRADPRRPAVFVMVPSLVESRQARTMTIGRYIDAMRVLVGGGRPVLVNVEPSMVVAAGGPDPVLAPLTSMGVNVDSGRVLLEEGKSGTRRVVSPNAEMVTPLIERSARASAGTSDTATGGTESHAGGVGGVVAGSLEGLATRLVMSVSMTLDANKAAEQGVAGGALLQAPATAERWLESEWSEYRDAVLQLRGDYTRINQGPRRDTSGDRQATDAAYNLAMAVVRPMPDTAREASKGGRAGGDSSSGEQRLVVVGAAGWFTDAVAQQQAEVDGRVVPLLPGNMQLLESSVLWLAGQEAVLARGAVSVSTPTIPALSDGQVSTIRWVLAAGLPLLVLLLGLVYRQLRR